jgi:hypothetical protein
MHYMADFISEKNLFVPKLLTCSFQHCGINMFIKYGDSVPEHYKPSVKRTQNTKYSSHFRNKMLQALNFSLFIVLKNLLNPFLIENI